MTTMMTATVSAQHDRHMDGDRHDGSHDFRFFLQEELVRRCKKNPRFSLRAFARTLDVEASALSKIMNGKRALTKRMLHRMSEQLGLGPEQVQAFERSLPQNRRPALRLRHGSPSDVCQVNVDAFHVLSDWYHNAILELITLRRFQQQPSWIARTLGVSVSEVNFALERLARLNLLANDERGRWQTKQATPAACSFMASARQKLQKQVLAQAIEAMDSVPSELREQSSVTMAIRLDRLPEAKERIQQFQRELCGLLQDGGDHDEVYQLSISLFPISRAHSTEEVK